MKTYMCKLMKNGMAQQYYFIHAEDTETVRKHMKTVATPGGGEWVVQEPGWPGLCYGA